MNFQTIFENPFDFERYIEDRLLVIKDIEERAFARKYLTETLKKMMHNWEHAYKQLEERVYAEIPALGDSHHVYITVVNREQYDITNGAWFPLITKDEKPHLPHKITDEGESTIDHIFYSGEGRHSSLQTDNVQVQGTVKTASGTYNATFCLIPSQTYKDIAGYMYSLFRTNGIPWTTLNSGYLSRFYDVQIVKTANTLAKNEEILDYSLSLGALGDSIKRNHIPVWNVQRLLYDSNQFVVPTIDAKYYEHAFPSDTFGLEHGYLIENNQDIISLRQTENEIHIVTAQETFRQWVAYQIIHNPTQQSHGLTYPVLHNAPKDSFVGRYMASGGVFLQSKLEMIRQVEQYDLMGLVALKDVMLLTDSTEKYDNTHMSVMNVSPIKDFRKTYLPLENLNWFIQDDLVNRAEQKVLLFHFESLTSTPHFLQYDLLCFVISQVQRQFNEYRCEAILSPKGTSIEYRGDNKP